MRLSGKNLSPGAKNADRQTYTRAGNQVTTSGKCTDQENVIISTSLAVAALSNTWNSSSTSLFSNRIPYLTLWKYPDTIYWKYLHLMHMDGSKVHFLNFTLQVFQVIQASSSLSTWEWIRGRVKDKCERKAEPESEKEDTRDGPFMLSSTTNEIIAFMFAYNFTAVNVSP